MTDRRSELVTTLRSLGWSSHRHRSGWEAISPAHDILITCGCKSNYEPSEPGSVWVYVSVEQFVQFPSSATDTEIIALVDFLVVRGTAPVFCEVEPPLIRVGIEGQLAMFGDGS